VKKLTEWAMMGGLCLLSLFALNTPVFARQVTDDLGHQITVPDKVSNIADAWFAHHSLLMTLGAGGEIVATVNHPASRPWMFRVQPSLNQALMVRGTAFNSESLLAKKVDVVFASAGDANVAAMRQAGLAVLEMRFSDFDSMLHSLHTTAEVVNTPQALAQDAAYGTYLKAMIAQISQKTASLSAAQRPKVLHIASLNPLKVDGSDTLIDTWIKLAGGQNAATGLKGNLQEVSLEQLLVWQPDVIILAADAGKWQDSQQAALLAQLNAVKQQHVWRNPSGVFPWDRYGTETALQIQWVAQKLHPEAFPDLDMNVQTREFYQRFFNYKLTPQDAAHILAGENP
jgi:iron complex transport system substrate-binding protein